MVADKLRGFLARKVRNRVMFSFADGACRSDGLSFYFLLILSIKDGRTFYWQRVNLKAV